MESSVHCSTNSYAAKLRAIREKRGGLSVIKASGMADIPWRTWTSWERSESTPGEKNLAKLRAAFPGEI